MKLAPFLLDQWLEQANEPGSPVKYDLAASTGPNWTLRELLALDPDAEARMLEDAVVYSPPAGLLALRESIANAHGVDPEHVLVVTGASEALLILFYLAAESGANIVLPKPCFPAKSALAESLGIEPRFYELRRENRFRMDPEEIRRLVDRNTRFVIVNSPHNPTGAILSDGEMESLHDFCAGRGVQLVSDEVYHPIYHSTPARSAARLEHATVLGDFSKAMCVSGVRLGWIIERDSGRREQYLNARSYFTISNSIVCEGLATIAMNHRETVYDRLRRSCEKNLALLDRFFGQHRDVLAWVRPGGGMTAFPWLSDGSDARELCRRSIERGVMLAPGDCFGAREHFRLGFGASEDRFGEGLDRIAQVLSPLKAACK